MIQGITLIISPLLALSSDQMRNLKQRTADLPDVTCIHLDGMPEAHVSIIVDHISGMRHPITKLVKGALILFPSPQFLTGPKGQSILNLLLDKWTSAMHMTEMDEVVHISSQFRNTFRGKFRLLKSKFYEKLPSCCNINLFMMGTCNKLILVMHFQKLHGVKVNDMHWPDYHEMRHRSVSIKLNYTQMVLKEVN